MVPRSSLFRLSIVDQHTRVRTVTRRSLFQRYFTTVRQFDRTTGSQTVRRVVMRRPLLQRLETTTRQRAESSCVTPVEPDAGDEPADAAPANVIPAIKADRKSTLLNS